MRRLALMMEPIFLLPALLCTTESVVSRGCGTVWCWPLTHASQSLAARMRAILPEHNDVLLCQSL